MFRTFWGAYLPPKPRKRPKIDNKCCGWKNLPYVLCAETGVADIVGAETAGVETGLAYEEETVTVDAGSEVIEDNS